MCLHGAVIDPRRRGRAVAPGLEAPLLRSVGPDASPARGPRPRPRRVEGLGKRGDDDEAVQATGSGLWRRRRVDQRRPDRGDYPWTTWVVEEAGRRCRNGDARRLAAGLGALGPLRAAPWNGAADGESPEERETRFNGGGLCPALVSSWVTLEWRFPKASRHGRTRKPGASCEDDSADIDRPHLGRPGECTGRTLEIATPAARTTTEIAVSRNAPRLALRVPSGRAAPHSFPSRRPQCPPGGVHRRPRGGGGGLVERLRDRPAEGLRRRARADGPRAGPTQRGPTHPSIRRTCSSPRSSLALSASSAAPLACGGAAAGGRAEARGRLRRASSPGSPGASWRCLSGNRMSRYQTPMGWRHDARDAAVRQRRLTRSAWEFWTGRAGRDARGRGHVAAAVPRAVAARVLCRSSRASVARRRRGGVTPGSLPPGLRRKGSHRPPSVKQQPETRTAGPPGPLGGVTRESLPPPLRRKVCIGCHRSPAAGTLETAR